MPAIGVTTLDRVFGALAGSMIAQQQRLDAEYLKECDAFQVCLNRFGYNALTAGFFPPRIVAQQSQVECRFSLRRTTETDFEVRVLNRTAASRYSSSRSFETKVRVTVQRDPLPPEAKENKNEYSF